MKHLTQIVLVLLATCAGVVQAAGRGADKMFPMHTGVGAGNGTYGPTGVVYSGRPNDSIVFPRMRGSEGQAEFAVMEMRESAAIQGGTAYHGRPMDNPHAQLR